MILWYLNETNSYLINFSLRWPNSHQPLGMSLTAPTQDPTTTYHQPPPWQTVVAGQRVSAAKETSHPLTQSLLILQKIVMLDRSLPSLEIQKVALPSWHIPSRRHNFLTLRSEWMWGSGIPVSSLERAVPSGNPASVMLPQIDDRL